MVIRKIRRCLATFSYYSSLIVSATNFPFNLFTCRIPNTPQITSAQSQGVSSIITSSPGLDGESGEALQTVPATEVTGSWSELPIVAGLTENAWQFLMFVEMVSLVLVSASRNLLVLSIITGTWM